MSGQHYNHAMQFGFLAMLVAVLTAMLPPLTPDERGVLSEVEDDGAFVQTVALDVLIHHTLTWSADSVETGRLPQPPYELLLKDPAQFRGDPFMIRGQLVRRDERPLGRNDLEAWIVMPVFDQDVAPIPNSMAVLLPTASFDAGQFDPLPVSIQLPVRFFARLRVSNLSDEEMPLLLFVGNHPQLVAAGTSVTATSAGSPVTLIVVLVFVLGLLFLALRVGLRARMRSRATAGHFTRYDDNDDAEDEPASLPQEPAEALEVLRERAGRVSEQGE